MNEVWTPWLPPEGAPARACVQAEMAAPKVLVERKPMPLPSKLTPAVK